LMMQAPNGKTSNTKVVYIFKAIKMDLNFASFRFFMILRWDQLNWKS
jgi:hypothetical protein